jgi:predicted enzyme involved in methoxymalonyl-ACP biosynthesis
MSCRVLKRGVETLLHNFLCRWALQHGLRRICGEFIPTAKNGIVKDHFAALGFAKLAEEADGHAFWEFCIPDDWIPQATQIEEEDLFAHREEGTIPFVRPVERDESVRTFRAA